MKKSRGFADKRTAKGGSEPEDLFKKAVRCLRAEQAAEASELFQRVLAEQADHAGALYNLGVLLLHKGDPAAVDVLRRAAAVTAMKPETHFALGLALANLGRLQEGVSAYREAIALQPDFAEAHNNLGNALSALRKLEQAEASYRRALALQPNYAEAHNNLGTVLLAMKNIEAAAACFRQALTLRPSYPEAVGNLGRCFEEQRMPVEAEALFRRTLVNLPGHPELLGNLGNVLVQQGRYDEALEMYDQALRRRPSDPLHHLNRSFVLLLGGNFAAGWAEYEWRLQIPELAVRMRATGRPRWDGVSPLVDKTILLQTEQGFGDAIQFVRYASVMAQAGARVIVECPDCLRRVLAACPGVEAVVTPDEPLPDIDLHAPLMSLPYLLKTELETIPGSVPYLQTPRSGDAPDERIEENTLSNCLKIGLVWAPGRNRTFAARHCPLRLFEPLLQVEGTQFFSLYKGDCLEELEPYRDRVVDLGTHFADFADTARAIEPLDLVITVDTAVAHLAGALGRHVWVLVPFAPDWRWLLDREDIPWYPTVRLFRQTAFGDWDAVIFRVEEALRNRLHA